MRDEPRPDPWYRQILRQMRGYVVDDMALKALAALIVTALWLSVAGQNRPRTTSILRGVDVQLENVPPNLIVTSTDPQQADITVRGPEDEIRELRIPVLRTADLVAIADLSRLTEGVHLVPLRLQGTPDDVFQVTTSRTDVRVTLEPLRTREVPVEARLTGQPAPGFRVVGAAISPPVVTLRGAESYVNAIEAVKTTTVSLAGRTAPFEETIDLDIPNPDVFALVSSQVTLTVDIQPEERERTFDDLVVTSQATVTPATVSVSLRGPAPVLDALTSAQISVTLEPEGAPSGSAAPEVTIDHPDAAKIAVVRVTPAAVRFRR
jgi:YbbR domain-containing protein